jgi:hypothetical protein
LVVIKLGGEAKSIRVTLVRTEPPSHPFLVTDPERETFADFGAAFCEWFARVAYGCQRNS